MLPTLTEGASRAQHAKHTPSLWSWDLKVGGIEAWRRQLTQIQKLLPGRGCEVLRNLVALTFGAQRLARACHLAHALGSPLRPGPVQEKRAHVCARAVCTVRKVHRAVLRRGSPEPRLGRREPAAVHDECPDKHLMQEVFVCNSKFLV